MAAIDLDGRRFDAGFLALALFQKLDLVAALLGPARVHAQQHAGPVLALGAAGAGMDLEIAVVCVRLAGEQRLHLAARDLGPELAQRVLGLGYGLLVLLGLPHLDQHLLVIELALDAADRGKLVLERGALLHHALGALGIVPEIRILGLSVELLKPPARLVDVKDASSAAQRTA